MKKYIIFIVSALVISCGPRDKTPLLGSVTFNKSGTASVILNVPANNQAPWRLRFGSPDIKSDKSQNSNIVKVFLVNEDSLPLEIYVGRGKGDVTILPGATEKIFEGSLNELLLVGRTATEELVLRSTSKRAIKIILNFAYDLTYEKADVNISSWYLNYGM